MSIKKSATKNSATKAVSAATQSTKFPTLLDQPPQRGNRFSRALFKNLFLAQGWQLQGEIPNLAKAVAIVAPHTSNYDAWYGFLAMLGLGIRLTIFGKHSLLKGPLKNFYRWMGVIPIFRESPQGMTQQIVEQIQQHDKIWIGIAPEGTRKAATKIKSGFYHIAQAANLPIVIFALDYANKSIRVLAVFHPTGDYEADLAKILDYYRGNFSAKNSHWLSKPFTKTLEK
ncbi:lysophospholipid acyltransferase family protein [Acinetobacter larvae]|uniref:lysophospholipid acyltransferase family protein n=1 Tax=Acinetobacter larvae TaxID=1789224 RepID=UPI0009D6E7AE|nr:lysophospholipid acyltransferase family protein [Acinetobacter larvae]